MRRLLVLLVALAGCAARPAADSSVRPDDPQRRTLIPGGVDVLTFENDVAPVAVSGNPRVVEVLPGAGPRQMNVIARQQGASRVVIYGARGGVERTLTYYVIGKDLPAMAASARAMLEGVEGVTVRVEELNVVLDGQVRDTKQMDRVVRVMRTLAPDVINLVTVDPRFYELQARLMEDEIRKEPWGRHVRIVYLNGTYMLVGWVAREPERVHAEAIVQALLPELQDRPAVRDSVLIAGAKKYSIRNLLEVTGK